MVEFALVSIPFFLLVFGIIDFSVFSASKTSTTGATRNAARYAATHPTAWSTASSPPPNSIQGKLQITAIPARVINDDSHVTIQYIIPDSTTTGTLCGQYSVASHGGAGGMVWQSGYDNTRCPKAGNFIRVKVTYVYQLITPLSAQLGSAITIKSEAAELEEVTPSPAPS
jgi:Flp pilus assembly protein TadG